MGVAEGALGARGSWLVSARRSFLDAVFHDETARWSRATPTCW